MHVIYANANELDKFTNKQESQFLNTNEGNYADVRSERYDVAGVFQVRKSVPW